MGILDFFEDRKNKLKNESTGSTSHKPKERINEIAQEILAERKNQKSKSFVMKIKKAVCIILMTGSIFFAGYFILHLILGGNLMSRAKEWITENFYSIVTIVISILIFYGSSGNIVGNGEKC